MKVSLWFYPNEQKKSTKTEKLPLYVRVILNGKKSEGRLYHAEITLKEKALWDGRTMRLSDPKHHANKLINAVQKEFDDFILINRKNLTNYSPNAIRDLLLGRTQDGKGVEPTVIDYIEKYYTSTVEQNPNLSIGKYDKFQKKYGVKGKTEAFS